MIENKLKVEALKTRYIPDIINYWLNSDEDYIRNMGADPDRLPTEVEFKKKYLDEIITARSEKSSMLLVWKMDDKPIGHCNVNEIEYGRTANLHLHIWDAKNRKSGAGSYLLNDSIALFFINLKLQQIVCEPKASNPGPNKTLEKLGFTFVGSVRKASSSIASVEDLNTWVITRERFLGIG